jgi:hypothetical protein
MATMYKLYRMRDSSDLSEEGWGGDFSLLDRSGGSFLASLSDTGSYSSFCLVLRLLLAFRMGKVAPAYLANPVLYH